MSQLDSISRVDGMAMPLRGNDIDTDRIIPARFLKCVVFNELGDHAFEDDRKQMAEKGGVHPLDDPRFKQASILFVNRNFGCGSSREHAPQSLMRRGIKALVGESFAEIFFGNCLSLGIPCLTQESREIFQLMDWAEKDPDAQWSLDLHTKTLSGPMSINLTIPEGARNQFLAGNWNPLAALLSNRQSISSVEKALPYRF